MKNCNITLKNQVILFMDIHDFSVVSRVFGEDKIGFFQLLQEIYEALGDVIVEHEGEIIKYLGDAILCIFPADSENKVVECSLELRKAFLELVRSRSISHDTELEIGIGAGEVGVGIFGHKSLMQKDVFGEEVNRAATIGHHRGIAITESVYDKIKTNYRTSELPALKVKWQEEPLRIWEIVE